MNSTDAVDAARKSLAPVGTYLPVPFTAAPPVDLQREAVSRLERAGYHAAWTNETVDGKDPLVQLALLLPAACPGTGGAACCGDSLSSLSSRAFSARNRASSASTATESSATGTRYRREAGRIAPAQAEALDGTVPLTMRDEPFPFRPLFGDIGHRRGPG
jgi:hypothetical protein